MSLQVSAALLREFDSEYDATSEDHAAEELGDFLTAFPLKKLNKLRIDKYVIGRKTATFCAYVEPKTKSWANIRGATAFKFGIYFGKEKTDSKQRYRFIKKFGNDPGEAFSRVKQALLNLIADGRSRNFEEVDANPLSQMFKAKILSLYFPNIYLNVCSGEHIRRIAKKLKIPTDRPTSELQHLLLEAKHSRVITKNWSNPKFMTFLYNTYIRKRSERLNLKNTRAKKPPKIDISDMLENRKRIGELSERFALRWERRRLVGRGFKRLINTIGDRRDRPGYGYDFLSHSSPKVQRFIEVKSAGRNRSASGYRFFLSENELRVSRSPAHKNEYYFYLVFYKNRKPYSLKEVKASDFMKSAELGPNGYVVAFDLDNVD